MTEYQLNLFDPAVQYNPYSSYAEMRDVGEVLWNPIMNSWMVWRFEDVREILADPATYSSAFMRQRDQALAKARGDTEHTDNFGAPTMLQSDPPDHTRYRGVVARAFTPRAIAAQEPVLAQLAKDLLEPLATSGRCEIVAAISSPLPILGIAAMLGVASRDVDTFRRWSDDFVTVGDIPTEQELAKTKAASAALRSYFDGEISQRKEGSADRDDLLARLVEANEGGVLSDAELLASCVLLLVAGDETTTNLITNMTLQLDRHPDQRKQVAKDPALIPGAIEETLRFDGPVHFTIRGATRDVEVAGQPIRSGESILVMVAAANRDPAKFANPDSYDITRGAKDHLGFGHGIHFCLGSTLARLETRAAMEALFEAAPNYRLALGDAPLTYTRSNLRSPRRLPIERV